MARDKALAEVKALRGQCLSPSNAVLDTYRAERDAARKEVESWKAAWEKADKRCQELRQAVAAALYPSTHVPGNHLPCVRNPDVNHRGACRHCKICGGCYALCECFDPSQVVSHT